MALTIDATSLTTISSAETITGWTGPTLAQEDEIIKEGTFSISSIIRNDGTQEYYTVTNQDYTNEHLRLWISTGVYGLMNTTGKTGLRFFIYDGTNTAYWNIADKSTYQGGWINIVVDANSPDTGTVTLTSIDRLGVEFGLTASSKRVVNTYVDYLRYGDGYTTYGTAWNFADVATGDTNNGYGITTLYEGVYFLSGSIQIGRATEQTTFSEVGSQLSFVSAPVDSGLFGLTIIGQASSTFEIDGCVLATAGQPFYLDFDDTGIADLTFTGNTIQGASTSHFRALSTACEVSGNVFDGCGIVYPQGSDFNNNVVKNTSVTGTDGSVYITDTTTLTNMEGITFESYSGKYAVHIPASITGSITLDAFLFDGSGTDVYWAGTSGTLTITLSNGSNASTSSTGGGTVVFVTNPVTTEITAFKAGTTTPIQGARVYLECTAGGPLPVGVTVSITSSALVATVTHTAHGYTTGDYVVIKGATDRAYNGAYTITVTGVNTYTYTMNETPSASPATGTLTATTVIFNTLTDVNGKVTDSRALSSNQPVSGHVRKSTSSPYYKTSPLTGPINNTTGLTITAQMVPDE